MNEYFKVLYLFFALLCTRFCKFNVYRLRINPRDELDLSFERLLLESDEDENEADDIDA